MKIKTRNIQTHAPIAVVEGNQQETNFAVLQPVLYDLIALGRVLKQLHWNVVGPGFRPIHLHLDEIYAVVDDATDEVAERLAATGHSPNGRIADVGEHSEIEDVPAGFTMDSEVLKLAEHALRRAASLIRTRTLEIEDVDTVTADLLHTIAFSLEKHHWQLEVQQVRVNS